MSKILKQSYWLFFILTTIFASQAFAHGMSEAEKQTIIEGGNFHYILIGSSHMLSGYDHLLFVFGIVFFLTSFRDIVKYITAFTLGHSITLIFATFNAVAINYFLIDAIIGLSVCYIAFVNLDGFRKYLNINPPNMLIMITGLGLIHGLGLSTRLQQLPLNKDELLMNIISFNVGIEVGQIVALAFMLLLITAFRKTKIFKPFSLITNYFLIFAGIFFFLMQMHGYEHSVNKKEYEVKEKSQISDNTNVEQNKNSNKKSQWKDLIKITIPAKGEKEYKFWIEKDKILEYSWKTNGEKLYFDFHGEPAGDTTGYFKSHKESTDNTYSGTLKAPFVGTHGWYWKNETSKPVTIILRAKGEYKRFDL